MKRGTLQLGHIDAETGEILAQVSIPAFDLAEAKERRAFSQWLRNGGIHPEELPDGLVEAMGAPEGWEPVEARPSLSNLSERALWAALDSGGVVKATQRQERDKGPFPFGSQITPEGERAREPKNKPKRGNQGRLSSASIDDRPTCKGWPKKGKRGG